MKFLKKFFSNVLNKNSETESSNTQDNLKQFARDVVEKEFQTTLNQENKINFYHPRIQEILSEYNEQFFKIFQISKDQYELKFENENVVVMVTNSIFEEELSKSDKLSLAYEHIFMRLVHKEFKQFNARLFLQSENSFKRHYNYTTSLGKKLAFKVKRTGKKTVLLSKSSYERSLIHKSVKNISGVSTKSIGPSHQRKLVLYPNSESSA